jgi:hypothetical protein
VSLQVPQRRAALSAEVGSNEGSFASAQSGDAGAEKIAARFALARSAGLEIGSALARGAIRSNEATARRVDLSFMQVSFGGAARLAAALKEEGARTLLRGAQRHPRQSQIRRRAIAR